MSSTAPFQSPDLPGGPGWPEPPTPQKPPSETAPGPDAQTSTITAPDASGGTPTSTTQPTPAQSSSDTIDGGQGASSISAAGGLDQHDAEREVPPTPIAAAPLTSPAASSPPPAAPPTPPAPATETPSITLLNGSSDDVLGSLLGTWEGNGFNAIWVPNTAHGHFLMLNLTDDEIAFENISGPIPNRGLLQPDINMRGITYMQRIKDSDTKNTMHIEPGLLAIVPETTHPHVPATVIRLGSIPHGTSILAQGIVSFGQGKPTIPDNDIFTFAINSPSDRRNFDETKIGPVALPFQSFSPGVTQEIVNNPNSLLQKVCENANVRSFVKFDLTTDNSVAPGGGVANTAFLQGVVGEAPNALVQKVTYSLWIETLEGDDVQLQYSQTVLLNFAGFSWPHVSVGTLRKKVAVG